MADVTGRLTIRHPDGRTYKVHRPVYERLYAPQGFYIVGEDTAARNLQPGQAADGDGPDDEADVLYTFWSAPGGNHDDNHADAPDAAGDEQE